MQTPNSEREGPVGATADITAPLEPKRKECLGNPRMMPRSSSVNLCVCYLRNPQPVWASQISRYEVSLAECRPHSETGGQGESGRCNILSFIPYHIDKGLPRWLSGKRICLPIQEMLVQSLGWEDPLEKEMATHSSILARIISWTEEPGGLQSLGPQRGGHD